MNREFYRCSQLVAMARTGDEGPMTVGEGPGTRDGGPTKRPLEAKATTETCACDHARIAIVHCLRVQTLHLHLLQGVPLELKFDSGGISVRARRLRRSSNLNHSRTMKMRQTDPGELDVLH